MNKEKTMKVKFNACEHLDYGPNYGPCKRQLISHNGTKICWRRPYINPSMPGDLVQFCLKRGRINNPVGCLSKANAFCCEYKEAEKVIDVPQEELDS